jgi:hypothetical protein
MIFDQNVIVLEKPLMDTAWTILEAAIDLGDGAAVEACRRVIDATLRGGTPAQSDIKAISGFFG